MNAVEKEVADLWDENKEIKMSAAPVSKFTRRAEDANDDSATPPPVNQRRTSPPGVLQSNGAVLDPLPNQSSSRSLEASAASSDETSVQDVIPRDSPGSGVQQSPVARLAAPDPPQSSLVAAEQRRLEDEEEESIALARMLMEQEAVESYGALSADYLRYHSNQFSPEDLEALQAVLAEDENPEEAEPDLDYDLMLRLGESIGDVKKDRWRMTAQAHIDKLEILTFDPRAVQDKDENDSDVKCLVCQFPYEANEALNRLPCGHCFHVECVSQWLKSNEVCPYCRQTILQDGANTPE